MESTRRAAPLPELFPVHLEPDWHGGLEVLAGGHERAERPPGQFEHLKGADDPACVPEPACRDRVHGFQSRSQWRRSRGFQFRFEPAPDGRVGAREFQHVQGGADVEPGAAGQDGAFAACVDAGDEFPGLLLEVRDAGFLGHIQDVQEMVWHSPAFGPGDLGGTDVHAAVELHGIGVDDLAVELQCERDREIGLAGAGRPDDGDHRQSRVLHCPVLRRPGRPADLSQTNGHGWEGWACPGTPRCRRERIPAAGAPQESAWDLSQASPARERRRL